MHAARLTAAGSGPSAPRAVGAGLLWARRALKVTATGRVGVCRTLLADGVHSASRELASAASTVTYITRC
jgi:hypothetical protein